MIKYNENTINDWFYSTDNIIKVYRNNAICYYKISGTPPSPTAQTPCYAVVEDISQYSDTEFEDVFNKADGKWYKLNNLNQYEQYGVYGSGRNITYYDGKLTVDASYEYQYSGGSWVNVGEVSGSTATLPNVPFTVNFNAKNYDSQTKTLLKTSGQLADADAVITAGTPTVGDGYLTIASGTRATISGYQTYFNRTNSAPNLTIISKQRTDVSNCHMFANRDSSYNWMYRPYSTKLTLHGGSETGQLSVTTQPVIESARVDSSRNVKYNNYTDNTTSTTSSFSYGSTNSGKFALFAGYASSSGEWFVGDFYWVYMSQNTLTDEQVQQVIDYNEGGGGQPEYPKYYDEIQDPPNNLVFSSMAEAEAYECPWVGMSATINGDKYVFSGDSQSGYEWVYNPSRLPIGYTEVEYIQNTGTSYLDTNFKPNTNTRILTEMQAVSTSNYPRLFGAGMWNAAAGINLAYQTDGGTNNIHINWYGNTSWSYYTSFTFDYNKHTYDLNKNYLYRDGTLVGSTSYTTSYQSTDNLGVFTYISGGRPSSSGYWGQEHFIGKMYSFQIYDNGTLVRDLVPCKRDNDNTVGAYDIVNDVFYTVPTGYTTDKLIAGDPV